MTLANYSEVMEDFWVVGRSLAIKEGDVVVSVASGGDNVFNCLNANPKAVYGVDVSAPQIDLCRLKAAVITNAGYPQFCKLMGYMPAEASELRTLGDRLFPREGREAAVEAVVAHGGLSQCSMLEQFLRPLRAGIASASPPRVL